ncbi:hypothetical protein G6F42_003719 [Rhizopus arrhizus]|nr:hypothetical protein G6F42_003719 [Rhizopus arrhizus]
MLIRESHSALVEDEDLILPLKWKPGEDFTNASIPVDSYAVAQTEWTVTKNAYTLYVSGEANNGKFIPVLVALHEEVNHATMLETIIYCAMVYAEFRLLPTVLIISIDSSSSLEDNIEINPVENSYLVQCKSDFWAHRWFLFFPHSVYINASSTPIHSLTTLCQFLSDSNKTLHFARNVEAHTIHMTCEAATNRKS